MSNTDIDQTMPVQPKNDDMGVTQPVSTADKQGNVESSEQTVMMKSQPDENLNGVTIAIKPKTEDNKSNPSTGNVPLASEKDPSGASNPPDDISPEWQPQKPRRWRWILLGVLVVLILGTVGSFIGYQIAIQMRVQNQASQVALTAAAQYQLAMADISSGKFDIARQRLEYVIQLDPNFPGAVDALTQVMVFMAETAVPTNVPTATAIPMTPTPDTRTEQQLFDEANSQLRAHNWDGAIATVEILRKTNLTYRAVDVDGMYYTGLRHRGIEKIIGGSLESGMYDLALAERIGPLDHDAESYRNWARYYLVGASFWRVDWGRVVEVFGEIYSSLPNLSDGTGWTAQERYRVACINYADQLAQQELYCDARFYYDQAFAIGSAGEAASRATAVKLICEPPTATPTMTLEVTITPTVTLTPEVIVTTEDPLAATCCPGGVHDPTIPGCETYTCPSP